MQQPSLAGNAPRSLAVTHLALTDFRCYHTARLDLDPGPVLLTGPNGAGKTNLLEAVSFLTPGKGLRGAQARDIDRRDGPGGWAVAAKVLSTHGPVRLGTARSPESERRDARINGAPARGQTELGEYLSAVWLTPQMDRLFLDGASARRRFLDRMVFGVDPAHAGRVSAYDKAMRERARLLRDGPADPAWLSALERQMAERGIAVAAARLSMATALDGACATPTGAFPAARLALEGMLENWLGECPALEAEDRLTKALASSRGRDREAGNTAFGPHRADLRVFMRDSAMEAALCSTGEQKALLIAVTLAHARLQAKRTGCAPVLLLDEVVAHLDSGRREALFESLEEVGAQAWLTGTDVALFRGILGRAQHVEVASATLVRKA